MFEGLGMSVEIFEWLLGQTRNPWILEHYEAQDEIVQREFPNGDNLGDVCYADIKGWYKRTKLKAKGKKLHIHVGIAAPCKGYLPIQKKKGSPGLLHEESCVMVPAVCILQELQNLKDEEDTIMFVSEQSRNLDKWDQWILEKGLG